MSSSQKTAKGVMTDVEVFANSFGFLGAGNEITAVALSFVSYELALNPDIQDKLQSEIDAYFEDKPVSHIVMVKSYSCSCIITAGIEPLHSSTRDHLP